MRCFSFVVVALDDYAENLPTNKAEIFHLCPIQDDLLTANRSSTVGYLLKKIVCNFLINSDRNIQICSFGISKSNHINILTYFFVSRQLLSLYLTVILTSNL